MGGISSLGVMRSLVLLAALSACTLPARVPDDQLEAYYAQAQVQLQAAGRMRTERAPGDASFTITDLVENFVRVALYDEFAQVGGRFIPRQTKRSLRRWKTPIILSVVTGPSVGQDQSTRDVRAVNDFARRLSGLSGVPVRRPGRREPNFTVLFLNRAEQRLLGSELQRNLPDIPPAITDAIVNSPPEAFCVAYTFGDGEGGKTIGAALILVKAEHRGLMRQSCIEEEMAQAMGLGNDSPKARPSIFNDDEEFALMTTHDEILLRMLYDKRLRPGMTEAEARPLLPAIARDAVRAARAENLLAAR